MYGVYRLWDFLQTPAIDHDTIRVTHLVAGVFRDLARPARRIERRRHIGANISVERRYFLSSLLGNALEIAHAVREHWAIENSLHWAIDVTFSEDSSRVRINHTAENFAMLCKIALNLLSNNGSPRGIRGKRKIAGGNDDFLVRILTS